MSPEEELDLMLRFVDGIYWLITLVLVVVIVFVSLSFFFPKEVERPGFRSVNPSALRQP